MAELIGDGVLKGFLSFPRTTQPVTATVMYDGQTGATLCVKFMGRSAVSALISRGNIENYPVVKRNRQWALPDAWKNKETIAELLQFIEREEARHDAKDHVA